MKYYKELDGLRFFAVFFVIISHWFPKSHFLNFTPNGSIGVTIFFVLSGFLISSILFRYKEKIQRGDSTIGETLKVFFIRRSLRIFPIYYLLIFFLFIYGYPAITENILYFVSYTSNILMFKEQTFFGTVSHLWTLSVEEQYYLIWPFILFLLQQKRVKVVILILILFSVSTQFIMNQSFEYYNFLTFNAFDAFGLGSLLAYYKLYQEESLNSLQNILMGIVAVMSIFFISKLEFFTTQTFVSCLTVIFLIFIMSAKYKNAFFNKLLRNSVLMYIGKISYGIYLFHTFIPGLMDNFYPEILKSLPASTYIIFIINFIVLIFICTISWFLFESPLNNLKKRFELLNRKKKPIMKEINTKITNFDYVENN
jgi:peptidoglycan/LPS O-acetylase OafA/YrhL